MCVVADEAAGLVKAPDDSAASSARDGCGWPRHWEGGVADHGRHVAEDVTAEAAQTR
jgi:hypothetical protein